MSVRSDSEVPGLADRLAARYAGAVGDRPVEGMFALLILLLTALIAARLFPAHTQWIALFYALAARAGLWLRDRATVSLRTMPPETQTRHLINVGLGYTLLVSASMMLTALVLLLYWFFWRL